MQSRTHKILSVAVVATLGLGTAITQAQPNPEVVKRAAQARAGAGPLHPPGAAARPQIRPAQVPPAAVRAQAARVEGARVQAMRGAGPNRDWYQGGRMPPQYRTHHYVVNDWRMHRLSAPPRGYHWVQNGADYLLVAIATGVFTSVILNNAY